MATISGRHLCNFKHRIKQKQKDNCHSITVWKNTYVPIHSYLPPQSTQISLLSPFLYIFFFILAGLATPPPQVPSNLSYMIPWVSVTCHSYPGTKPVFAWSSWWRWNASNCHNLESLTDREITRNLQVNLWNRSLHWIMKYFNPIRISRSRRGFLQKDDSVFLVFLLSIDTSSMGRQMFYLHSIYTRAIWWGARTRHHSSAVMDTLNIKYFK